MITLTEFSRSATSARAGRMIYEDLALVAHLSELELSASEAQRGSQARLKAGTGENGYGLMASFRQSFERTLSLFRPHPSRKGLYLDGTGDSCR